MIKLFLFVFMSSSLRVSVARNFFLSSTIRNTRMSINIAAQYLLTWHIHLNIRGNGFSRRLKIFHPFKIQRFAEGF